MNANYIASNSHSDNVENHSAPDKVLEDNRAAFATGLAQSAFGAAYAPPLQADFCDRAPGEIAIIRAAGWRGAAR